MTAPIRLRALPDSYLTSVPDLEMIAPPAPLLGRQPTVEEAKGWLARIGSDAHHVVIAVHPDGEKYTFWVYGTNTVPATVKQIQEANHKVLRIFDLR